MAQPSPITTVNSQTLQLMTNADPPTTPAAAAHTDPVTHTTPIILDAPIVPVTPIVISIDPSPQQPIAPVIIQVSSETQWLITRCANAKLVQFWLTLHAMAGSDAQKRAVIDLAITDTIPGIIGMHGVMHGMQLIP
ncbi:hypothetical protein DFH29DRAFT_1005743 [Suillus ampliporus]|nr:hypothetical protein DFH29DRAFT_1005743 [Suillus ampliporus]